MLNVYNYEARGICTRFMGEGYYKVMGSMLNCNIGG
jgi:hypothetical protein